MISHQFLLDWARIWAGVRPAQRTTCLKTQTSEHPCQTGGPSPQEQAFHCVYEARGVQQSLHPDKRRHGACLETLPQTAKTAPLAPSSIQNATTKPVNDTQACSFEYSHLEEHQDNTNTLSSHTCTSFNSLNTYIFVLSASQKLNQVQDYLPKSQSISVSIT